MPLRRSALIALMFALVVAAWIRPAGAGQVTGYYVCVLSVSENDGKTSTVYLSDVIPNTGFRPGPVATAFRNSLGQVNSKMPAQCFERGTEAAARQLLQQSAHPGEKLVLTGWKYGAAGAPRATPTPSPANPSAPQEPSKGDRGYAAAGPAGPLQGYCFEYAIQKLFITKSFLYGRPTGEGVNEEFSAYVAKTYGAPPYAAARCAALRDPKLVENGRQNEINDLRRTPSLELVEIDWAPAPKPTSPAQTPAPAAAPQASAPASAAAKPAPIQTVAPYSYCYASGSPQGPGNGKPRRQHFYVTPLFARAATDRPDGDWQKFIRAAHTDEAFNASCTSPGPRATAEKARTDQLASMGKLANFDVVEVDWKR